MKDPIAAGESIRVCFLCICPHTYLLMLPVGPQRSQADWFPSETGDLREALRIKTLAFSEDWQKHRAAQEGPKDGSSGDTEEGQKAKAKARPEPEEDDDDVEVICSEIRPAPNTKASRGRPKVLRIR